MRSTSATNRLSIAIVGRKSVLLEVQDLHKTFDTHGGRVAAASAGENAGATFTVTLPLEEP